NLKYVRGQARRGQLTTFFELLGVDVVQGYLGDRARVEMFGTSTDAVDAPLFHGSLWQKLQILERELRARIVPSSEDEVADAGDFGIDVVAWFPFADDIEGRFITVLAQCACGKQWSPKMSEPTADALVETIRFTTPVVNLLLIPYCFRTAEGEWHKSRGVR